MGGGGSKDTSDIERRRDEAETARREMIDRAARAEAELQATLRAQEQIRRLEQEIERDRRRQDEAEQARWEAELQAAHKEQIRRLEQERERDRRRQDEAEQARREAELQAAHKDQIRRIEEERERDKRRQVEAEQARREAERQSARKAEEHLQEMQRRRDEAEVAKREMAERAAQAEAELEAKRKVEELITTPWRPVDFTQEKYDKLLEICCSLSIPESLCARMNVLLVGLPGVGKSSFCNTVSAAVTGKYAHEMRTASQGESFTTRLGRIAPENLKFRFWDTRGLEDQTALFDVERAMGGYLLDRHEFGEKNDYRANPEFKHKMHIVVFVVRADTVQATDERTKELFRSIAKTAEKREIATATIITAIDKLDHKLRDDITKVYYHRLLKDIIEACSFVIGTPVAQIYPIQNYCEGTDSNLNINILALDVLKFLVQISIGMIRQLKANEDDVF